MPEPHGAHFEALETAAKVHDRYLQALQVAADLYPTNKAAGEAAAVSATIIFLRDSNTESRLRTPLLAVLGHLEDQRQGRSGNTKTNMETVNMAAMAAVITLAMNGGQSMKAAAQMVAKHTGIGEHHAQSVRQLVQYRKNLTGRRVSSRDAQKRYDLMISEANAAIKAGVSPRDVLAIGLEHLRNMMAGTSLPATRPRQSTLPGSVVE